MFSKRSSPHHRALKLQIIIMVFFFLRLLTITKIPSTRNFQLITILYPITRRWAMEPLVKTPRWYYNMKLDMREERRDAKVENELKKMKSYVLGVGNDAQMVEWDGKYSSDKRNNFNLVVLFKISLPYLHFIFFYFLWQSLSVHIKPAFESGGLLWNKVKQT